ncbi:acetylneuraminic acid synthetase [Candidatus Woesearchaeota archaeon]|jgi:sialic acid synthase SpsE|nr:acetylneuraminic acid synthetase [Candidatus Woesearchaeota archaeon]
MKEPEIIAEIGVNYYDVSGKLGIGLVDAAKEMILRCKNSGIKTVKFQTYKAEKIAAEYSPSYWDLNEEPTRSQKELFSKFDKFGENEYKELADYCKVNGVEFMSTPFDIESADFIDQLVSRHKIASADITNLQLLKKIADFGKPVILSTGASKQEEVTEAVDILERFGCNDITLLHCVLSYPTAQKDANLWKIRALLKQFPDLRVGLSDHSTFSLDVLIAAWLLGVEVIEKHFTLDKALRGNDHYHAADPQDFIKLQDKIKLLKEIYGNERTDWLFKCEEEAYINARRGVYLNIDVKKSDKLRIEHLSFLRPQLSGLSPKQVMDCIENESVYTDYFKKGKLLTEDAVYKLANKSLY